MTPFWQSYPSQPAPQPDWQRAARLFRTCRSWWLGAMVGWAVPFALLASPGRAAEEVYLSFGLLERSISFSALETFAKEGRITAELRPYTRLLSQAQRDQLQTVLNNRVELGPVAISQFLYSDQGEVLLQRFGEVVQTESFRPGAQGLRAALVLAAADPEGITPLNVLRQFPLRAVRIDVNQAARLASQLETLIRQTQQAVDAIALQAAENTTFQLTPDYNRLPDLQEAGPYLWQKQTILLNDDTRDRVFLADVYLPITATGAPLDAPAPTVVISHGLGSNRDTFAYLATHLASYGMVVAVPEHPGSNTEQLDALVSGRASQVIDPAEFIDRPLDIRYLLDRLQVLSQTDQLFLNRVDVDRTGVLGQSLGGYTAIALAGASLNLNQLGNECRANNIFNLSLLLQCRVLETPNAQSLNFRDERVKAIFTINPLGSSLLDQTDLAAINIPIVIAAGSADTITPALIEQIQPFTRLTATDRYLLLMENGTHFSSIDVPKTDNVTFSLPTEAVGPDPAIAHSYLRPLSLSFFGAHLANEPSLKPYLTSAYANYLSQPALPIYWLGSFTADQLAAALLAQTSNNRIE
ncbi:alpha/beta hydrolase [Leptolyngbya sp. AN02str]|uniref:alpha/beta hydrolase n=1 Tax=Leptolyngbya sp. AN02str TaxID=3423363 RepID=UPI003D313558